MTFRRATIALMFAFASVTGVATVPAHGDPLSSCTPRVGTIVAVDFGHWGGPVVRGCGVNASNGYDLLQRAGFTTAGTVHDGPGFVCRLGNAAFAGGTQYPTPDDEACVLTPPTSAYWSFWTSPAGADHWTYSSTGATTVAAQPGAVHLWTFGSTNLSGSTGSAVPTIDPATLRATQPPPPPTAHRPSSGTSPPPSPSAPDRTGATVTPQSVAPSGPATTSPLETKRRGAARNQRKATSTTVANDDARRDPTTTTRAPSGAASTSPAAGAGDRVQVVAAQPTAATRPSSSGPPWSLLVAGIVVVAFGGATALAVRRRRAGTT